MQKFFFFFFFGSLGVADVLLGVAAAFLPGAGATGVLLGVVVVAGAFLGVGISGVSFAADESPFAVKGFEGDALPFLCEGMLCMDSEKSVGNNKSYVRRWSRERKQSDCW